MRLSYNWLKELANFKESPEKLAEILNMRVAQVEKIEKLGQGLDKLIVAEILEIKPHPNADKLQVAIIDTGKNKLEIVCGAPNIRVGQKVPLALPGAKLANKVEIKESIIRGVKSAGMLCAEDELGIGPDHTGIYILPPETEIGQPIAKILGLDDTIFEIENKSITHRSDLFNHLGFAREIAAITNKKIQYPTFGIRRQQRKFNNISLKIEVDDFRLCPRYMAVVMDNIKLGPSPFWLQNRLRNLGIRPINNIVDITNYVLVEYGQPLHAFDFDKLDKGIQKSKINPPTDGQESKTIIVRKAHKGEKLLALDGREYELKEDDLIIADSRRPIALAGVMGGELFSIAPNTKTIVIESANFEPTTIRRTAWRLGLQSESSLRFEKGLPFNFPELGMQRAIELVQKLAGGETISQVYDLVGKEAAKKLKQPIKISFEPERARKFIGLKIADKLMLKILTNLGCQVKKVGKKYIVTPPIYRPDLVLFEDLIEEIIRVYGTDKIIPQPICGEIKIVQYEKEFLLEREIKNILVGLGFDEVYNYSFTQINTDRNADQHRLEIANPLNPEQRYLRTSLVTNLIKNAEKNRNYFDEFRIFEIGKVFDPEENKKLAGLIYKNDSRLYLLAKGVIELILNKLGIAEKMIGSITQVEKNMVVFELSFEDLLRFSKKNKQYEPISIYPLIKRDLAFLIDKKITWREIFEAVKDINPLIKQIELFDVFEDKKFGQKRNLAFHIVYQSNERTLKAEEVDKIQEKIIQILKEKFDAELRIF